MELVISQLQRVLDWGVFDSDYKVHNKHVKPQSVAVAVIIIQDKPVGGQLSVVGLDSNIPFHLDSAMMSHVNMPPPVSAGCHAVGKLDPVQHTLALR